MTSLEIAEVTGKQHKHVMRDIRVLIEQGVNQLNFEPVEYTDKKGDKHCLYPLTVTRKCGFLPKTDYTKS